MVICSNISIFSTFSEISSIRVTHNLNARFNEYLNQSHKLIVLNNEVAVVLELSD